MLHSKTDFIHYLSKIVTPLKDYYTAGCAGIKCGHTSAHYSERVALLEAFSRVLWGLAPLWGGGKDCKELDAKCLQGIINGTDPEHPEYWGEITSGSQKMVETAALGLALVLAPHKVWEPLTEHQKENFHNWLMQMNVAQADGDNWKFFAVMVNLGLKNVGVSYSREIIDHGIECFDSYYDSNGWYHDGQSRQTDYYIAFAIHFYGLIYAKVMEEEDPVNSRKFKERAMLFAQDFIYWFAEDGSALAFGRSLTYRFAQCSFWCACVFAGIEPFSMGVMKGIITRHLEWWLSKPIFDNGGILTVGYGYPNYIMAEFYNAFGSPYWALKSFLILALPDDHEFFTTEALPLPKLEALHIIPQANMVMQHFGNNTVALTSGQWANWNPTHCAEKYSKFAYSSKYAFSVPHSNIGIEKAGTDSMLAFDIDGVIVVRRDYDEYSISKEGTVYSKWSPFRGITVETTLIPTKDGHIRKHIVSSDLDCVAYDCGFATPLEPQGGVEGKGEAVVIDCEPNTNLMNPSTKMNAVRYEIKKGVTEIETKVVYEG
ncbi:MAG: DUF2264 domain-containing protein [Clostridia bacterium]|nr:DUF2264 domain-containing protein [Clostridia bacterium]